MSLGSLPPPSLQCRQSNQLTPRTQIQARRILWVSLSCTSQMWPFVQIEGKTLGPQSLQLALLWDSLHGSGLQSLPQRRRGEPVRSQVLPSGFETKDRSALCTLQFHFKCDFQVEEESLLEWRMHRARLYSRTFPTEYGKKTREENDIVENVSMMKQKEVIHFPSHIKTEPPRQVEGSLQF